MIPISQQAPLTFADNTLFYHDLPLLRETAASPIAFIGRGDADVAMYQGNFEISDNMQAKLPLTLSNHAINENEIILTLGFQGEAYLELTCFLDASDRLVIKPKLLKAGWNRFWIRLTADQHEHVYGCGEQLSHLDLRGRHFPLWTSEPGVGRNKHTLTTFQADQTHSGGDYYTTNYPAPTFISTRMYYCHVASYDYADFDFRNDDFHELQFWGLPLSLTFDTASTFPELITKLTGLVGRTTGLPDWTNNGLILGVQGGTKRVSEIADQLKENDVALSGIWAQDWEGIRMTSFGKRLYWDWKADDKLYPNLTTSIKHWQDQGIEFLGYINPYIANDTQLFADVKDLGYFAKNKDGEIYLVDFGEFLCGVVDFTNPDAFTWYKELIKKRLISTGMKGWMADFGEYLPTDVVLYDHSDPMVMHNKWPVLWAQCNYEAVKESGLQDEIMYFMRAGGTGSQKYAPVLWAGNQSVNWSLDDGLAATIPAALSAGLTGNSISHSDIGGYTSLYGNIRSRELFMRWAEMAAFTPVMRTHEGNRPDQNFQVYDDYDASVHLAHATQTFKALTPYRKTVVAEAVNQGLPAQRPLFMHYPDDDGTYDIQYEYLLGRDLLVAPVYRPGKQAWSTYLPKDNWIHLWTGEHFTGGDTVEVQAPLGQMPVFYRADSAFASLFEKIGAKH